MKKLKCYPAMGYFKSLILLFLIITNIQSTTLQAQDAYVYASTLWGNDNKNGDKLAQALIHDDYVYIYGGYHLNAAFAKFDLDLNHILTESWGGWSQGISMNIIGNEVHTWGRMLRGNQGFPTTDGSNTYIPPSSKYAFYYKKLDLNGNLLFSTVFPGSETETIFNVKFDGNIAHVVGTATSPNLPVTDGSTLNIGSNGFGQDMFYLIYDVTTNTILHLGYTGGSAIEYWPLVEIDGNYSYIALFTGSSDFQTTDGTIYSGSTSTRYDMVVIKFDLTTNTIQHSTIIPTSNFSFAEEPLEMTIDNNKVYVQGKGRTATTDGTGQINWDNNGIFCALDDSLKIDVLTNGPSEAGYGRVDGETVFHNGYFYAVRTHPGDSYASGPGPTIDGSTSSGLYQDYDAYISKYDMQGKVVWGKYIADIEDQNALGLFVKDDKVHVSIVTNSEYLPTTDGSTIGTYVPPNNVPINTIAHYIRYYTIHDANTGKSISSHFVNQGGYQVINRESNKVILNGTKSYHFGHGEIFTPTTDGTFFEDINGSPPTIAKDISIIALEHCPTLGFVGSPVLTPAQQTVCVFGLIDEIEGEHYYIPGSNLPIMTTSEGDVITQNNIYSNYQWQQAPSSSGPWTEIIGATDKNFSPPPLGATTCFRRLAKTQECCVDSILQISDVACVIVDQNVAPVVDVGGIYNTCPGTPVTLTATVTGGTPPYSYEWAEGNNTTILSTTSTLVVTPSSTASSVYTVTVTDSSPLSCMRIDQAIVIPHQVNAGMNVGYCEGSSGVLIGTAAIGVPGATYSWSPTTGLSCTTCPQPYAFPTITTNYTVTMTIPVTGGGTCSTTDMVTVTPTSAPTNPNFAGPDKTICFGSTTTIGENAGSGWQNYDFTWAPGSYLADNHQMIATFNHGNLAFPFPNPITYYSSAELNGCVWYDTMTLSVIRANALQDGCGPRIVGDIDRTPFINETYQWTQLSGDGMFTGPTNIPQTSVSASLTSSTYLLEVAHNGTVCTDSVVVPQCGCAVFVQVDAPTGCPSYDGSAGDVCLIADASSVFGPGPFVFTWTPQVGLTNYIGDTVCLTDNVPRTYTVTVTTPVDPNFSCSATVEVNNPAWSEPIFGAKDQDACPGDQINIGEAAIAGYSYEWYPTYNLNSGVISNPLAQIIGSQVYTVTVTDLGTGCINVDTVNINAEGPYASAGDNISICDNGVVKLGRPAVPNTNYTWSPANANWQNGTDEFSAQPEVLIAITSTYSVTATNTVNGCTDIDQVTVTVNAPIPPFSMPDLTYCPSTSGALKLGSGAPTGGGIQYLWSPAGWLVDATIANPWTLNPPPSDTTIFTLTLTAPNGCVTIAQQALYPQIGGPIVDGNKTICVGEDINIGSWANETGPGISYSWTPPTYLDNPTSPNPLFTAQVAGTFTYTVVKNKNGCASSKSTTVTVNELDVGPLPATIACQNSCVQIGFAAPVPGVVDYLWTPATGLSDPTIYNPIACVSMNTIYTLNVTGQNGCEDEVEVEVFVSGQPAPTVTVPDVFACTGQNGIVFNPVVTPPGMYTYNWSPDSTLVNSNSPTPSVIATGLGTYTYYVTVTDQNTGCYTIAPANLIVGDTCTCLMTVDLNANNALCNGEANGSISTIVLSGRPPYSFNWSNGQSTPTLTGLTAGTYTLTVTDVDGCVATGMETVNEPSLLLCSTTVISDVTIYGGSDGSASASGNGGMPGYSYAWESGQTGPTATGLVAGTYIVTITDTNSCESTCTVDIVEPGCEPCLDAKANNVDLCVEIGGNPNHPLASLDCDNGGINNYIECNNSGDPWEPTDDCLVAISIGENICLLINGNPDHPMAEDDCDQGGVPNLVECDNGGDPSDPADDCTIVKDAGINVCIYINWDLNHPMATKDCDTGGVDNYTECQFGTDVNDPADDCVAAVRGNIDICAAINGDPNHPWASLDCDLGGIINITECNNGADPSHPSDDLNCPPNLCFEAIQGNIDICTELGNDPNHPVGPIDCDGDGVTNADECIDGTDPLDPCDFVDTSITLPVTADLSECLNLCPDLTPVTTILPGNIAGASAVEVAVEVTELNVIDTDGSLIIVRMPSDPRLAFVWDIGLTMAALTPVQNADWNYLGDNGIVHTFTYNGNNLIINAGGTAAFGFQSIYDPQSTDGQTTITATIIPFSGGECNIINNSDSERLVYFE